MEKLHVRFVRTTGDFKVVFLNRPKTIFVVRALDEQARVEVCGEFEGIPQPLRLMLQKIALNEARKEARRLLMELQPS